MATRASKERMPAPCTISVSLRVRPELSIDDAPEISVTAPPSSEPPPLSRRRSSAEEEAYRKQSEIARHSILLDDSNANPGVATFGDKHFRFAHTFGPTSATDDVFKVTQESVLGVLRGIDATVMCYGSTGAGKTHTMIGSEHSPGVVPLALDALFDEMSHGTASYALQVSALELLEERCVDLLHGRALVVLRAGGGGLNFSGLKEISVSTKSHLLDLISAAMASRTVGSNHRHDASSRSHLVIRLRIDSARLVSIQPAANPPTPEPLDEEPSSPIYDQLTNSIGQLFGIKDGKEGGAVSSPPTAPDVSDAASSATAPSAEPPSAAAAAAADLGSTVSLKDATSATLTLIDLAGSEAVMQNTNEKAIKEGLNINKSLHWLKVAVHELAAKRTPSTLRNSALTRLLAPTLSGTAHVSLIVCSSLKPAATGQRDALETLTFGEVASKVTLKPTRRTEVSGGQLGKLQALLVQMADDRAALASDAAVLREQVAGYEEMIDQLRSGFVTRESLASAEDEAAKAALELQRANELNEELAQRCLEEESARVTLMNQLAEVEEAAAVARERNESLLEKTQEAAEERASLEARLSGARLELEQSRDSAKAHELELEQQRSAVSSLLSQVQHLDQQLTIEREAAAKREAEAAALAESNSALEARVAKAQENAMVKDQLTLLRHKLYHAKRGRPSTAGMASVVASQPPGQQRRPSAALGLPSGLPPPRQTAAPPRPATAAAAVDIADREEMGA